MKMKRLTLTLLLLVAIAFNALADTVVIDGLKFFVEPTSKEATLIANDYKGDIIIPLDITYNGETFLVTTIGDKCFYECKEVTSVKIPNSVTMIGTSCFFECTSLENINLPNSITEIQSTAFYGCERIKNITIPNKLTTLRASVFAKCNGLTSIQIPYSVQRIESSCFYGCENLEEVDLNNVNRLEDYVFASCTKLKKVIFPPRLIWMGRQCFDGCGFEELELPSSIVTLNPYVFSDCKNLKKIKLGKFTNAIFYGAFCNCEKLEEIICPNTDVPSINDNAFEGVPMTTCILYVPQGSEDLYKTNSVFSQFKNIRPIEDDTRPFTETPTISYKDGKLRFECNTTGAEYHYTISDSNVATDKYNENGEVQLDGKLDISVYATADGYRASDRANATIYWLDGEETTDNINLAKNKRGVMVSTNNGITISGLSDGEVITIYSVDGKNLGSAKAIQGTAHFNTPIQSLVILKINGKEIKISTL